VLVLVLVIAVAVARNAAVDGVGHCGVGNPERGSVVALNGSSTSLLHDDQPANHDTLVIGS
jgi:hypothetical protein